MNRLLNWFRRSRGLSHEEVHGLATDYVDGTLPPTLSNRFRQHIASCEDCNRFVATFRATVLTLRDLPRKEYRPDLVERIRARIKADADNESGSSGQQPA